MSKILLAIVDGKAKEFQAVVNGVVRWVVKFDGKFYTNNRGRFIPVAKSKITQFVAQNDTAH